MLKLQKGHHVHLSFLWGLGSKLQFSLLPLSDFPSLGKCTFLRAMIFSMHFFSIIHSLKQIILNKGCWVSNSAQKWGKAQVPLTSYLSNSIHSICHETVEPPSKPMTSSEKDDNATERTGQCAVYLAWTGQDPEIFFISYKFFQSRK